MALTSWDPFREMEELLERYSHTNKPHRKALMKNGENAIESGDWMPVVDIDETRQAFIVKAELPGVEKNDVKVNIENNVLTIKGEKKTGINDKKSHRVECSYGTFLRSFTLPQSIQAEQVTAEYKNGILLLTIPKKEEARPKQIEVKVS